MNIIDQLKKNKRPLILMNSELQNAMLSMPPKEFICLQHTSTLNDPQWETAVSDQWYVNDNLYNIYALSPDYTDEPKIVECKITIGGCSAWLGKLVYIDEKVLEQGICEVKGDPNFAGFLFKPVFGEEIYTELWLNLDVEHNGNYKMTHASHVRIRRKKEE